jgi:excisionase family DNA binding protein
MQNLELFGSDHMTPSEAAERLGVSTATVYNWTKLGILNSGGASRKTLISSSAVEELRSKIHSGESEKLQKRANKKFVVKRRVHDELNDFAVEEFLRQVDGLAETDPEKILVAIAQRILNELVVQDNKSSEMVRARTWMVRLEEEVSNWLAQLQVDSRSIQGVTESLPEIPLVDDILGKVYQHLSASSKKAVGGVFYTPSSTAAEILEEHQADGCRILDPACGSGIFLIGALRRKIQSRETNPLSSIFGIDIDPVAVRICRINLLLIAKDVYVDCLNIYHHDGITSLMGGGSERLPKTFELIVTNPPWGSETALPLDVELKRAGLCSDSFSVFLALSLDRLEVGGKLSFLLPQAFADVVAHAPVRKRVLGRASRIKIKKLGKLFKGLLTDVLCIELENTPPTTDSTVTLLSDSGETSPAQSQLSATADSSFIFGAAASEVKVLNKIMSFPHRFIGSESRFALGIVTGDNAKLISSTRSEGQEVILRGRDISPFDICPSEQYIKFDKRSFQQCADESNFRANEKLIYRFISDRFVFAYDDQQRLTLNSANIVIPNVGLPVKAVLGMLQSEVIAFVFAMKFSTLKILRRHVEAMPIFLFDAAVLDAIVGAVDKILMSSKADRDQNISLLNNLLFEALGLDEQAVAVMKAFIHSSRSKSS